MAQLLVRNLDEDLVRRLKLRAAAAGRSAEAEHRLILEQALKPDAAGFAERARKLRAELAGRPTTDSTVLIREDRDRNYEPPDDDPAW